MHVQKGFGDQSIFPILETGDKYTYLFNTTCYYMDSDTTHIYKSIVYIILLCNIFGNTIYRDKLYEPSYTTSKEK